MNGTEWLQSSIFSGGLQTSQIHYNYNEEKDEDHCSSLGTTTPDKAKLYSQRITLSDHAQPFLQAIADNNTQDHTVKVQPATPKSPRSRRVFHSINRSKPFPWSPRSTDAASHFQPVVLAFLSRRRTSCAKSSVAVSSTTSSRPSPSPRNTRWRKSVACCSAACSNTKTSVT